jgi:lipoprotein-anchoring transpeptidase ErfK/SrfK
MQPVKCVFPVAKYIKRSRAKGVLRPRRHTAVLGRVFRQLRLSGDHRHRRRPSRPFLPPLDDGFTAPNETLPANTASRFLYLVNSDGTAMRYGVGIGRQGFVWGGEAVVERRQKWPRWTPPAAMIARQPELARYSSQNGGMPPGPKNPLGARALYIFRDGRDTLYRLHGSPEWNSIGKAASSGCVRLINQDAIDLYERIPEKARVVIRREPVGSDGKPIAAYPGTLRQR